MRFERPFVVVNTQSYRSRSESAFSKLQNVQTAGGASENKRPPGNRTIDLESESTSSNQGDKGEDNDNDEVERRLSPQRSSASMAATTIGRRSKEEEKPSQCDSKDYSNSEEKHDNNYRPQRFLSIDDEITQSRSRRDSLALLNNNLPSVQRSDAHSFIKRLSAGTLCAEFPLSSSDLQESARICLIASDDFISETVQCLAIEQGKDLNCNSSIARALCEKLKPVLDVKRECEEYILNHGHLEAGQVFCQQLASNVDGLSASFAIHFFIGDDNSIDENRNSIQRAVDSCLETADALQLHSICFGPLRTGQRRKQEKRSSGDLSYDTGEGSEWMLASQSLFSSVLSYYHRNRYTTSLLEIRILCIDEEDAATLKDWFLLEHDKYQLNSGDQSTENQSKGVTTVAAPCKAGTKRSDETSSRSSSFSSDDTLENNIELEENPVHYYPCDISDLPAGATPEPDTLENVEYMDMMYKASSANSANKDRGSGNGDILQSPNDDSPPLSPSSPTSLSFSEGSMSSHYKENNGVTSDDNSGNCSSHSNRHFMRQIKSATLPKLIEHLTHFKASEDKHEYQFAFMLTYHSLTTSMELIDMLRNRYLLPPPSVDITPQEFAKWNREVLKPTRLRIVQILKYWMENQWNSDFEGNEQLVEKMEQFCELMEQTNGSAYSRQLRRTLERMQQDRSKMATHQVKVTMPPPIYPKNFAKMKAIAASGGGSASGSGGSGATQWRITSWHVKEIARQLTLIEFDMFRSIRNSELLNQSWNAKNRQHKASNIIKMITWFNTVARWVATEIVREESLKARVKKLSVMIAIANECRLLNNFNAVFEILSGMDLVAIHRLKQTWTALDKNARSTHEELKQLISLDYNFRNIRHQMLFCEPPCLPYIGIFLSDLVFIEDGIPNMVHGRINFCKRRKLARLIRGIMTYQNTPYKLTPVPELQQLLNNVSPMTESELYSESLLREQRH